MVNSPGFHSGNEGSIPSRDISFENYLTSNICNETASSKVVVNAALMINPLDHRLFQGGEIEQF